MCLLWFHDIAIYAAGVLTPFALGVLVILCFLLRELPACLWWLLQGRR